MRNFKIIPKHLGVADFHFNARFFFFFFFQLLQKGMTVGGNGTDFIQFFRKSIADDTTIANDHTWVIFYTPA